MERIFKDTHRGQFSFLHWRERKGLPILLFVHATGFNAHTYRTNLNLLKSDFEIFAIDLRGHGFSKAKADWNAFTSWDVYIDDLVSFIRKLPKPITLAGHSLGSMLCLALAARYPETVSHLLMIEPIIMTPIRTKLWALVKLLGQGKRIEIAAKAKNRRYIFETRDQIITTYTGRKAFKSWPSNILADYVDGGTKKSASGGIELTCHPNWEASSFANISHLSWSMLKQLRCKTRLVYATKSTTISEKVVRIIANRFPQISIARYEASHFIPMEETESVLKETLLLHSN